MELKVEQRLRYVFFFRSSILAHQVNGTEGKREVLILFTNAYVFVWVVRTTAMGRVA
jgi:hypothetical protein